MLHGVPDGRHISFAGVAALAVYFILDISGFAKSNDICNKISVYCLTRVFVTTAIMPLYITGLIKKIRWKNNLQNKFSISKPVMMIITAVLAYVLAAVLKLGLVQLFPNL